ncbi:MAG: ABC transporter ATP-binding protein, partial [Armatimonadetes bacterium]|nr:ABC transporter ATP-binding protein [Armatimonadota bacterium]
VGTTFVYVTHDQGEALTMSDRIAVMKDGRVEQVGSSQEIYSRPATRFVATFIGEANLLEAKVARAGNGEALIEAGALRFVASADGRLPEGAAVTVSLRPEHVKIGPAAEGCENRFEATVADLTFMGSIVRCRLALAGGQTLVSEVHNDEAADLAQGRRITVGWARASGVVLQR